MTYDELVEQIQLTTENNEATFVANIPFFVKRAEERIFRYVKLPALRKAVTTPLVQGDRSISTPTDFLAVDSIVLINGTAATTLVPKEPDFLREAYPTTSVQGAPKFYALQDHETLVLAPTANTAYSLELYYTYKPESLVTAGTSWLGDNAENALLYGSLVEAYIFMKGEADILALYESRFKEAVGVTKVLAEGKDRTDDFRNSPPRAPQTSGG